MSDTQDLVTLAENYLILRRCPGGRFIVDGYVCVHCLRDPTVEKCGKPKRKRKVKT